MQLLYFNSSLSLVRRMTQLPHPINLAVFESLSLSLSLSLIFNASLYHLFQKKKSSFMF